MINANAPDHRRTRSVYDKAFRPGDMTRYLPMMEDECRKLLDALPEGEPFDFMTALANPLPHRISLRLFDVPEEMDETIAKWIAALSWVGNIVMTPEQKREAANAQRDFKDWVRGHLAERSADPGKRTYRHLACSCRDRHDERGRDAQQRGHAHLGKPDDARRCWATGC